MTEARPAISTPLSQLLNDTDTDRDTDSVEQEILRLIASQSRQSPVPVFIAVALLALIAASRIPVWMAAVWFVLAVVMLIVRFRALRSLPLRTDLPASQRLQRVVTLNLANGMVHALCLFSFPSLSEPERAFFSVLLLGLCSGSVGTSAGYRPALLAYIAPVMGLLTVLWALSPGVAQPSLVERVIALLMVFYSAILLGLARELHRAIVQAWEIRFREHELNEKLRVALEVAESASRAKTRFLAAASHDLRQPLHTITMLGAALSMRGGDERSQQMVALLNEVTGAFSTQLDGLLDISKLDAGVVQTERKPVCISAVLTRHMAEIASLLEAKNIEPVLLCETDDYADTDEQLFLRVLRNLTQNAIKFTDHGSIALEVRRRRADGADASADSIEVVVADTGRGIPLDQQDKVFQEFYQIGNPERDRSQGLGLGLSIVRRMLDLLDIDMLMLSRPGQGTRFVLNLPLAALQTGAPSTPAETPQARVFDLTVLVIDDEKSVRTGMRILLEELGCRCLEASGTASAAAQVKHLRPDLVLADFRLRGIDSGTEAIAAVHARWPGVPAVLVSGDTAPSRLQEAQRLGMRLLHKPLALQTLKQELTQAQAVASLR
ncbi:MAG: ATP-binding protein [Burkholderiaceae bacterium]